MADMTSRNPGDDEISEVPEVAPKPCFGGNEEVVAPRSEVSDEEVISDFLDIDYLIYNRKSDKELKKVRSPKDLEMLIFLIGL